MFDNKYDRINTLASKDAARDQLAAAMADFEKKHGKVKTTPIMQRDSTGTFHNIEAERMNQSRKRGRAKSTAAHKAKAAKPQTPLRTRGTPQAKANALLRQEWT